MGGGGRSKKLTADEIKKHNSATSGWVVIEKRVYDVSSYITKHPGGRVLLSALGELDSTGGLPNWAG